MKTHKALLISCLAIITSFGAQAITYEVIGPCSNIPLYKGSYEIKDLSMSAGLASVSIFEQQKIPYIGNESGFNSIASTPIGLDSMEVISDTKMRAYGWCYSVNGIEPDILAGDFKFTKNSDKLVWFYAYSTYDKGQWLDYCVPSYKIKASQFCSK